MLIRYLCSEVCVGCPPYCAVKRASLCDMASGKSVPVTKELVLWRPERNNVDITRYFFEIRKFYGLWLTCIWFMLMKLLSDI
jgi:hypothetical protein